MRQGQLGEMRRQSLDAVSLLRRSSPLISSAVSEITADLPIGSGPIAMVGSGDSATLAAQIAVRRGGVARGWWVVTPHDLSILRAGDCELVVAVSASGSNAPLVDGLQFVAAAGIPTVAVSGRADGPVARAASKVLLSDTGSAAPSPAVASYLLGMVALDAFAAAIRPDPVGRLLDDEMRLPSLGPPTETLAARLAGVDRLFVLGTRASLPSAAYLAAKLTEVLGVWSAAVRCDEWVHVHRFAAAQGEPVLVWSPGPDELGELPAVAERLDRHDLAGIAVTTRCDQNSWPERVSIGSTCAPEIAGTVLAALLAVRLGEISGREPFSGRPLTET